jgi:hypothetical protein
LYQLLQKNITNINLLRKLLLFFQIIFNVKVLDKLKNMIDIVLILISNLYLMLLSYDSDMINRLENYIKNYTHFYYTKLLSNNQLIIRFKLQ